MKKIAIMLAMALTLTFSGAVYAQSYFDDETYPAKVIITGSAVNVRCAPSTGSKTVATLYKNNVVDCKGKMGDWYVVHLENDIVGLVSSKLAKGYYKNESKPAPKTPTATPAPKAPTVTPAPKPPAQTATPAPKTPSKTETPTGLTADEQEMLNLVNSERRKNGIAELTANLELTKVARLKSEDLVNNNYFAHNSPTYGTPFEMMKKFGIQYKTAGENLAANSTVSAAHAALMNSPGHRENILKAAYTEIGIGIVPSPTYGKMFTQMFIGK